jgi:hypothetical protein
VKSMIALTALVLLSPMQSSGASIREIAGDAESVAEAAVSAADAKPLRTVRLMFVTTKAIEEKAARVPWSATCAKERTRLASDTETLTALYRAKFCTDDLIAAIDALVHHLELIDPLLSERESDLLFEWRIRLSDVRSEAADLDLRLEAYLVERLRRADEVLRTCADEGP